LCGCDCSLLVRIIVLKHPDASFSESKPLSELRKATVLSFGSGLDSTDSSKPLRFQISKIVERELLVLGVQQIEVTCSILRTKFVAWLNVYEGLFIRLGLPSGLLPLGFPTKTLYTPLLSPIRATCPTNLISISSPEQYWVRSTDH